MKMIGISKFVTVCLFTLPLAAHSGPISGGGPLTHIWDVICHTDDGQFRVDVGLAKDSEPPPTSHEVLITQQNHGQPDMVTRRLDAHKVIASEAGRHLRYGGVDFLLSIPMTEPWGAFREKPGTLEAGLANGMPNYSGAVTCTIMAAGEPGI
jgi:hypothetical protein